MNKYEAFGTSGRVRYDKGHLELAVEWFSRDISGGDERRIFKRWSGHDDANDVGEEEAAHENTFNLTQLRAIDVKIQPVLPLGGVPLQVTGEEVRPTRRAATAISAMERVRNILYTSHKQYATPP